MRAISPSSGACGTRGPLRMLFMQGARVIHNVRIGSKAVFRRCPRQVRFSPHSDQAADITLRRRRAIFRLMQCERERLPSSSMNLRTIFSVKKPGRRKPTNWPAACSGLARQMSAANRDDRRHLVADRASGEATSQSQFLPLSGRVGRRRSGGYRRRTTAGARRVV